MTGLKNNFADSSGCLWESNKDENRHLVSTFMFIPISAVLQFCWIKVLYILYTHTYIHTVYACVYRTSMIKTKTRIVMSFHSRLLLLPWCVQTPGAATHTHLQQEQQSFFFFFARMQIYSTELPETKTENDFLLIIQVKVVTLWSDSN